MLSLTCRGPLDHFFAWTQKRIKIHNANLAEWKAKGKTYLGPTPLSDFATQQQTIILAEFNALLLAPMTGQPWSDIGSFVDKLLPAESGTIMFEAMQIIVTQVLMLIASWGFRYTDRLKLWLPVFELVALEPGVPSDKRKHVASHLLSALDCCLWHKDTDMFVKVR